VSAFITGRSLALGMLTLLPGRGNFLSGLLGQRRKALYTICSLVQLHCQLYCIRLLSLP
jgi:hypothetical protein